MASERLEVPAADLQERRVSTRAGVAAWAASEPGATRGPGRKVAVAVVEGDDVLAGRAGFDVWLQRHGREDPVAVAVAYHALVHGSTTEPYGSWTRGPRKQPDPAYDAEGRLVYFHAEPKRARLTRSRLTFAADGISEEQQAL